MSPNAGTKNQEKIDAFLLIMRHKYGSKLVSPEQMQVW